MFWKRAPSLCRKLKLSFIDCSDKKHYIIYPLIKKNQGNMLRVLNFLWFWHLTKKIQLIFNLCVHLLLKSIQKSAHNTFDFFYTWNNQKKEYIIHYQRERFLTGIWLEGYIFCFFISVAKERFILTYKIRDTWYNVLLVFSRLWMNYFI